MELSLSLATTRLPRSNVGTCSERWNRDESSTRAVCPCPARIEKTGSDRFNGNGDLRSLALVVSSRRCVRPAGPRRLRLGSVGSCRPSDARLRRAQSLAHHSGVAVRIASQLISQKLEGQERLTRDVLRNLAIARHDRHFPGPLANPPSVQAIQTNRIARPRKLTGQRGATFRSIFPPPTSIESRNIGKRSAPVNHR